MSVGGPAHQTNRHKHLFPHRFISHIPTNAYGRNSTIALPSSLIVVCMLFPFLSPPCSSTLTTRERRPSQTWSSPRWLLHLRPAPLYLCIGGGRVRLSAGPLRFGSGHSVGAPGNSASTSAAPCLRVATLLWCRPNPLL